MPISRSRLLGGLLGVAALLLALALRPTHSQTHPQLDVISDTCEAQLQSMWNNYTSPPVAPVAGCNKTCLAACYDTLNWAIYSERMQNCPHQTDIIRCMHVYRAQWLKYVQDCSLFAYGTSTNAEAEGEAGGSSSSPSAGAAPSAEGEASAEATPSAEGEATAEGEASGVAPTAEAGEASSESSTASAAPTAEAEAEAGRRRTLLQEAEAEATGGNGTSTYNGCFPAFANLAAFEAYINGEHEFKTSSDAVGITLSVLYYVTLLLVGVGLPTVIKAPLRKLKVKLMSCFRRRKPSGPTVLQPPAQPLVEAAAVESEPPAKAS